MQFAPGLGQLFARGGQLGRHVGLLGGIDGPCGPRLAQLQGELGGVDESHLGALVQRVTFVHVEAQQRAGLLGAHGGLRGLEGAGRVVVFFVARAGSEQQDCCQ